MSAASTPQTGTPAATRDGIVRSVLTNPLGLLAAALLTMVILAAVFAPQIAPFPADELQIFKINAPPGDGYFLGGDGSGRDIFSRLVYGARNTLTGALIAISVAASIGVTSGLFAGYFGGRREVVMSWISDGLMALPSLIVLLAFYQSLGSSIQVSMVIFGVMLAPGFYRLTRNLVNGVKHELYVDAARVSGLSDLRIIVRHILLVIRAPVIIQVSIVAGVSIVIQAGLEFLGLGDPAVPTWGGMLQDAFANMFVVPTAILWPGLAISVTVASFVLLANAIRDRLQQGNRVAKVAALPAPVAASAVGAAPGDKDALLEVRDLVVGYPSADGWTEVVKGVSLQLRRGEVLGLVGESGSGKTQTAFAVLGLLSTGGRILSGSIWFDGRDIANLPEEEMRKLRGKRIAYVPQEPMSNLDPAFRIGYQLTEPMVTVLGISRGEAKARALKLLARVGMPNPLRTFNAYPHQISGGMAQRVLIARAISCNPDLLIADEPTTALDVTVQAEVLELLRDLQAEMNMSVVLVTHNFGVVADICHRVSVMKDGKVVETSDVRSLFADPQHDYTKMLLGAVLDDVTPRVYRPLSVKEVSA
ncbi:dipeptide/oligopeptide/nickel ABC transporter ATP-binding protein [Devosia yakushimensis]|uniref:Dipeptide/oligopeptide/nickel ABC transporter ATP-binding protein n=1 Tax=Devosia yakushimensis TaxID=470028 RepID=A0ABQ5U840_9HYPH|nr:dipeptide/oligopeptide/nickel ABC transporter permease/ATP-binding protein [Devosia yakushimensis]GLQ08284.1 dipeptide/oligopeptide/nickel ABC transporter ATP-binding protein [Devosia yakushimensis]